MLGNFHLLPFILVVLSQSCRSQQVFYNYSYLFGREYNIGINDSIEYIFNYGGVQDILNNDFPVRISVTSNMANKSFPIFVTARQQQGSQSWQLPFVVGRVQLNSVERTLCPNSFYIPETKLSAYRTVGEERKQYHPIIHLYSSSPTNLTLTIRIDLVNDFYLTLDENTRDVRTSPSEPRIFYYNFNQDSSDRFRRELNRGGSNYLTVEPDNSLVKQSASTSKTTDDESKNTVVINFYSEDEICMIVSIQNASCPIFDNERDVSYDGLFATFSKSGGIRVTQRKFPQGFFIVLIVKSSNEACSGFPDNSTASHFSNFFEWKIQDFDSPKKDTESRNSKFKRVKLEINASISRKDYWIATWVMLIPIVVMYVSSLLCFRFMKWRPKVMDEINEPPEGFIMTDGNVHSRAPTDFVVEHFESTYGIRKKDCERTIVYLSELCKKEYIITKSTALYLWNIIIVAVFYGLPVVQLVITYQRVLNKTGDQDLCYYNFLCSHSLGGLSDFNHVFSNIAYVLLGALFIYLVRQRQKEHVDATFDKIYGIPQHYGLFYAMGVSLIMEGILSASYHVCPNRSNFQFDTSFMYTMAVICMVKIYQSRHPDVNARAHTTYSILAVSILICLLGVLFPNFYFWLFFTFLHIFTCLGISIEVYYMGYWKFGMCCVRECFTGGIFRPAYTYQCIFLVIANVCNWSLAGYGLYMHSKDFASHLLFIFLLNLALHFGFYITMKVVHKEKPPIYVWLLIAATLVLWAFSLKYFFTTTTSWAVTPAQSRNYNRKCNLLNFYDNHDIWHFLSAFALFLSFLILLFLDEDITHVSRDKIPVF